MNMLSPEEHAKREFFLVKFMSELKKSFQEEMGRRDEEAYLRGTQLKTLFSLIPPPGPHNPLGFLVDCGGKAKCAVKVSETKVQPGLELRLNFDGCNSGGMVYPMIFDGQAFKTIADAAEVTKEQIAKVVIDRLIQERLHWVN